MIAFYHPVVWKKCSIFSIAFLGQFDYIRLNGENVLCPGKSNTGDIFPLVWCYGDYYVVNWKVAEKDE